MTNLLAQQQIDIGGDTLSGFGKLGLEGGENAGTVFNSVISVAVGIMTAVASVWFIFQLITAAVAWIGAEGDKGKVEEARKKMTNAIIGLVVVISAVFLASLVGSILGLDILNPGTILENLSL